MTVRLKDGRVLSHRLPDVIPADLDLIRRRFRAAATKAIGAEAAKALASQESARQAEPPYGLSDLNKNKADGPGID